MTHGTELFMSLCLIINVVLQIVDPYIRLHIIIKTRQYCYNYHTCTYFVLMYIKLKGSKELMVIQVYFLTPKTKNCIRF